MSIKREVYIRILQGKTRTVNSDSKNELSAATNEVLDKIYFRVIDDNRKVGVNTTVLLIREIRRWIKAYREKIIPNILEPINPPLEEEKSKIYRDTISWVSKWEDWEVALIPENRGVMGGVDLNVDRFHFVKLNDKLLEPNKLLTYNQALFLLLGLNAIALDNELADFPEYTVFKGKKPTGRYSQFDFIFWNTPQNQALKTSAFVVDGKIASEDLGKLANDPVNRFFTELKPANLKTIQKNKNRESIQLTLLDFLESSTRNQKYSISELYQNSHFKKLLEDNKITISDTGEDANKNDSDRDPNEMTPRTLGEHLTTIFKCVKSDWWARQDEEVRNKVKKY